MSACHRDLLAECEWGTLERCSCGTIHFNLGPLTLRIIPETLTDLAKLFNQAAARVHAADHDMSGDGSRVRHYAS